MYELKLHFCSFFTYPDLQVIPSTINPSSAEMKCHSSCRLPYRSSFIWYKNGRKISGETSSSYTTNFNDADSYSCAVTGYEDFPSLPVCEFSSQSSTNITASCEAFYLKYCTMTSCISSMSDPTASLVIGTMFFSLSSTVVSINTIQPALCYCREICSFKIFKNEMVHPSCYR